MTAKPHDPGNEITHLREENRLLLQRLVYYRRRAQYYRDLYEETLKEEE